MVILTFIDRLKPVRFITGWDVAKMVRLPKFSGPSRQPPRWYNSPRLHLSFILLAILSLLLSAYTPPPANQVVRVGLYDNPPKIYMDTNGQAAGFWPAIVNAIAEKEGWKIEWVPGTWEENLARLESGEIDMMPDVGWTEARSELYTFSGETVLTSWARLYVPRGSSIESILDLNGKKVAGLNGSVNFDGPEGIKALAAKFGVECTFVSMDSYTEVFEAIQNHEVDAGVANKDFGDQNESKYNIERTSVILAPTSLRFAFTKNGDQTANLLRNIDADLKQMKADKSSVYYKALDSYLAESSQQNIIKVIPPWVYVVGINAACIIALLMLMVLIARKRIRERTASLEKSEARYRTLVENLPDLIFKLDKNYVFIDHHASPESILYAPPEEFLGQSVLKMLPPALAKITKKYLDQAVKTKKVVTYEYQLPMNGDTLDYEARINARNPEEIIVIIRDITDRKKAERDLHHSEERYHALGNLVPVGIFRTDAEGSTTFVNPAWCQIAGMTPDEALGDGWLKAVHPDDLEEVRNRWHKSTISSTGSNADYRFVHSDGSVVWVIGQAVPEKDDDGRIIGYIGTITDITERRKMQELKEAVIRAESADRLKSAFLATMSHELRTPLNSIIGFTGILLQGMVGPLNNEQQKQLRMIQGSSRHLLDLINDVLDISKIEAGQMTFSPEPFDYLDAVQSCLEKIKPMANKKKLSVVTTLPSAPLEIVSDRRRVEQVLLNLLNNAVKFTEQGQISLVCEVKENSLITRVIDTGIGIKEEDMAILFKPFSQVDTGLTRQYEGTGLGLSICKRLVDEMGGELSVKSEWGKGSEFYFTLPLKKGKK